MKIRNKCGNIEYELTLSFGGTDMLIVYMPSNYKLDVDKFRKWVEKQPRDELDELINVVYKKILEELNPMFLLVQIQRGGFKVNKPSLYAPERDPACYGVQVDAE